MSLLVLLRHGQSTWNRDERFTGWTDVPLTIDGKLQAKTAGEQLQPIAFDIAFTSKLSRAQQTLSIVLDHQQHRPTTVIDSALNERHYGHLQGLFKHEAEIRFGRSQIATWRRNFWARPPLGESIEDCGKRVIPFFCHYILPLVKEQNQNVIVVSHGNCLRPILALLEELTPEESMKSEIPHCLPILYAMKSGAMMKCTLDDVLP